MSILNDKLSSSRDQNTLQESSSTAARRPVIISLRPPKPKSILLTRFPRSVKKPAPYRASTVMKNKILNGVPSTDLVKVSSISGRFVSLQPPKPRQIPSSEPPCSAKKPGLPRDLCIAQNSGSTIIKETNLTVAGSDAPVYCLTPRDAAEAENVVLLVPVKPPSTSNPFSPTAVTPNRILLNVDRKNSSSSYVVPTSCTASSQGHRCTSDNFPQTLPNFSNTIGIQSSAHELLQNRHCTSGKFTKNLSLSTNKALPEDPCENFVNSQRNSVLSQKLHCDAENFARNLQPSNSTRIQTSTVNQSLATSQQNNELLKIENAYSSVIGTTLLDAKYQLDERVRNEQKTSLKKESNSGESSSSWGDPAENVLGKVNNPSISSQILPAGPTKTECISLLSSTENANPYRFLTSSICPTQSSLYHYNSQEKISNPNNISAEVFNSILTNIKKENVTESCGDITTVTFLDNNVHYPPRDVENALRTETIANRLAADESNNMLSNLKKENTSDSDNTNSFSVTSENGVLPISENIRNTGDRLHVKTENNDFCDISSPMTIKVENDTDNVKTPIITGQAEIKSPSTNHPCSYEERNIPRSSEIIKNKGTAIIKETTLKFADSDAPVYCLTPTGAIERDNVVLLVPVKPLCEAIPLTPTETTPNSTLPDTSMKKSSSPSFVPISWTTPSQELQLTANCFAQNHLHPSNAMRVCNTISDNSKELPWTSENVVLNQPYLSNSAKLPCSVSEHLKSSQMNCGSSQDLHCTVGNLAQSLLHPPNSMGILKRTANQNLVINQVNNDLMNIQNVYSSGQSNVLSTDFVRSPNISHQCVSVLPPKPMKIPSSNLPCSDRKPNHLRAEGMIESSSSAIIKETNIKIAGSDAPIYCLTPTDAAETENITLLIPVKPLCETNRLDQQVGNGQNPLLKSEISDFDGIPSSNMHPIEDASDNIKTSMISEDMIKTEPVDTEATGLQPNIKKEYLYEFSPLSPCPEQNVLHQPVSKENLSNNFAEEFKNILSNIKQENIFDSSIDSSVGILHNEDIHYPTGGAENSLDTEIFANGRIADESKDTLPIVKTENTSDSHIMQCDNIVDGNDVLCISSSVERNRPYMKTGNGDSICQGSGVIGNGDDHRLSNNAENSTMIQSENIGQETDINGVGDENSVMIASENFEQSGEPTAEIVNTEFKLLGYSEHNILRGVIDVEGNERSQTVQFEDVSDYTRSSEAVSDGNYETHSTLPKLTDKSVSNTNVRTMAQILEPLYKHIKGNKCLLCGFESKSNDTSRVRRHLITHLDTKHFKCDTCGKVFKTPRELSLHKDLHSDVSQTCVCETCGKTLPNRLLLSYHVRRHKTKKYTCTVCNKQYVNSDTLKAHYRIHTGEKPYACVVCNQTFRTNHELKNHVLHHNDKKMFPCDFCDKSYNRRQLLNQHMNTHKDSPAIKCSICEKSFNYKSNLAQHMLVHSDARRHTCETCGMKFKLPHHLRSHIDTHH